MGRRGGRGRTASGRLVQAYFWEALNRGAIMTELKRLQKVKGMAHQRDLHSKLRKIGMTDKDISKYEGELIRAGNIYQPRPLYLKTTESAGDYWKPRKRRKR